MIKAEAPTSSRSWTVSTMLFVTCGGTPTLFPKFRIWRESKRSSEMATIAITAIQMRVVRSTGR
jgi:hypothetical protein